MQKTPEADQAESHSGRRDAEKVASSDAKLPDGARRNPRKPQVTDDRDSENAPNAKDR